MSSVLVTPSGSADLSSAKRRIRELARPWVALSSRIYLPAAGLAAFAAVLVVLGWSDHWGGEYFGESLTDLRVVLVGPLALGILGIFLVAERLWPAQPRPLFARGHRHDLLLAILNALLVAPLVTALSLTFVAQVRVDLPWMVLPKIGILPRWVAVAGILIAMDGCNWFVHLANHRVRMLWRFHELHHSQEDMNVLTVFRTHPLIHVSYLLQLIPGVILLANGALSITVLVIYGGIVAFAHSNTRLSFGPFGRILVSPNYHRIHHQLNGPQDVNLGFALTIWDQMFHRAVFPNAGTVRIDTGLPGRPLIVEQMAPRPRHLAVLAAQMVAPFRPMRNGSMPPSVRSTPIQASTTTGRASRCTPSARSRDVPTEEAA